MKKNVLVFFALITLLSCKKDETYINPYLPKSEAKDKTEKQDKSATKKTQETITDFNSVLNKDNKQDFNLKKNTKSNKDETLQTNAKAAIEELYVLSGVPKEEYQHKINNPDTLKQLVKYVNKNIKDAKPRKGFQLKSSITKQALSSKNTPTGISIEEAILILHHDIKIKASPENLNKIDSVSGTSIISKLPEKEARNILRYVKNKENKKLRIFGIKPRQLHAIKDADAYILEINTMLKNYNNGSTIASLEYKKTLERALKMVKSARKKFVKKTKVAQNNFKKLNPELYFGEDVGETFFGDRNTAVFLPLGRLSFADKVIKAEHPKLKVLELNNVLGAPDVIQDIGAMTVTGIHSLGKAGTLTVEFVDNALTNVNGPDLYIFEIGKIEPTNLEISKDGLTWIKVGKIDGGVSEVDIEEFVEEGDLFYYVRLTDLKVSSGLPGADVDAIAAIGAAMRLQLDSKVLFESGKSVLKPKGFEALKTLAESISVLKKGNIIVEGHTDNVGDSNFNKKLSLARAKSVSAELKKLIPASTFKWKEKGLGESNPIVKNDTDENKAKNRRVEVLVIPN